MRQTIDHLVTLGRFADIRVYGEPDGDGVRLRYGLVALDRIAHVRFVGPLALDEATLRSELTERFGATPLASRRDEMVAVLEARYHARGFASATRRRALVAERPARRGGGDRRGDAGAADPGRRGDARGQRGRPTCSRASSWPPGVPSTARRSTSACRAAEDALRDQRYYEAVVSATVRDTGPARADVTVRASLGDRVRVDVHRR